MQPNQPQEKANSFRSIPDQDAYIIPIRYRKMENLHIVFWLFKDVAWCLGFTVLGITMIIPTMSIALLISWRTRHIMAERCHNIAITVWIAANSYWMITEFLGFDEAIVTGNISYKHLALIPFGIGLLVLGYYYLYWRLRHKHQ